jgi:hypothetical protein
MIDLIPLNVSSPARRSTPALNMVSPDKFGGDVNAGIDHNAVAVVDPDRIQVIRYGCIT